MTDIKETLATVFDDEPPLTIDRAAVQRAGRRRLARRRGFAVASAFLVVAAVSVPAVLLTGTGSEAPLQLGSATPSSSVGPFTSVPGQAPGPPSGFVDPPAPPKPVTAARAAELTALLAASGAIPADVAWQGVPGNPGGAWEFAVAKGEYRAVSEASTGGVVLNLEWGTEVVCGKPQPDGECQVRTVDGRQVLEYLSRSRGTSVLTILAAQPDGTAVRISAVNSDHRGNSTGDRPPLGIEQLTKIATLPGLTF